MPLYELTLATGESYEVDVPDEAALFKAEEYLTSLSKGAAPSTLQDVGVTAAQSVVGGAKSIMGAFGAEGDTAQSLGKMQKGIGEGFTPARQGEMQRRAQMEEAAAKSGSIGKEIAAGVGGVTEAPIQAATSGLGSSVVPLVLGAAAIPLGLAVGAPMAVAAGVGLAVRSIVGALQGAGEVKGDIYEAVKEGLMREEGLSEREAEAKARKAQEYTGDNWGSILAATGLGALAAGTGLEKDLIQRFVGKKAATEAAKKAAAGAAKKPPGLLGAVGAEALTEGAQGGQGKWATNVAMDRAGMETPAMQGVFGAAARDAATGAITAGAVRAIPGGKQATPPPPADMVQPDQEQTPLDKPDAATMSAADMSKELLELLKADKAKTATDEDKQRITELRAALKTANMAEMEKQTEVLQDETKAAGSAFAQPDMQQMEMREATVDQGTQAPPDAAPIPKPPEQLAPPEASGVKMPEIPTPQLPLFEITQRDIDNTGVKSKSSATWLTKNVVGKTREELRAMVDADPTLLEGKGARPQILRGLLNEPTAAAKPETGPVGDQPSVGVPVGGAGPGAAAGPVPPTTTPGEPRPAAPVGLVPPQADAGPGDADKGDVAGPVIRVPAQTEPLKQHTSKERSEEIAAKERTVGKYYDQDPNRTELELPAWGDLTRDAKDVYLDKIIRDTPEERRVAAGVLDAYLDKVRDVQGIGEIKASPASGVYERNRRAYTRGYVTPNEDPTQEGVHTSGLEFPTWDQLTPEQRDLYTATLAKDTTPRKADTEHGDAAFAAVRESLKREGYDPQPGMTYTAVREAQLKQSEAESLERVQRERAAGQEMASRGGVDWERRETRDMTPDEQAEVDEYNREVQKRHEERTEKPAEWIPDELVKVLRDPEKDPAKKAQQVLTWLGTGGKNKLNREIAKLIKKLGIKTKIKLVDTLPKKHVAQYDPSTDTVLVTSEGLTPTTLLHEFVHAATVTVLHKYKSSRNRRSGRVAGLTDEQVDAAEQLHEIMGAAKKAAKGRFKEAFTNIYEFLSYAMSDDSFQSFLRITPSDLATTTLPEERGLLTKFMDSVLRMLGGERLYTKGGETESPTLLMETLSAFEQIISVPEGGIGMAPLPAISQASKNIAAAQQAKIPTKVSTVPKTSTEARTLLVDSMASVVEKLNKTYAGAVRAANTVNPAILMRQAADTAKFIEQFMLQGSFGKDPVTGTYRVFSDPKRPPPAKVFEIITKMAKAAGVSMEAMKTDVSSILEGVRLNEMMKSNATGKTNFSLHMKPHEIAEHMRSYNSTPEIQEISKLLDASRIGLVDEMERVGRLDAATAKEWREVVGYVPFDRVEDAIKKLNKIKKATGRGIGQGWKDPDLIGSIERPVKDVFVNYVDTVGWMMRQVVTADAVTQSLEALAASGHARKLKSRASPNNGNVQAAWDSGTEVYYELPTKYDMMAFADYNPLPSAMAKFLGSIANVLRVTITALPPFAVKQVVDDVQRAMIHSGVQNPAALISQSLWNFVGIASYEAVGKRHPLVSQFGAKGIVGGVDIYTENATTHLMEVMGVKKRSLAAGLMHRLDGITRASDLAVRAAVHAQTMAEVNDLLLADTRARELINFRRHGANETVGFLLHTVPFLNAYIQGTDLVYRNATGKDSSMGISKGEARKMFFTRGVQLFAASVLYAIAKQGDDDYKKMSLRLRNANWILGDGVKIPVPGEIGALFKVSAEHLVEYFARSGTPEEIEAKDAVMNVVTTIMEQYVERAVPVPQGLKQVIEATTNYVGFTGRQLEGKHQQTLDASRRRASNTSELAIAISDWVRETTTGEISPIRIDHALTGFLGSTAGVVTLLTDGLLNPNRIDKPVEKWLLLSNFMYERGAHTGTRNTDEFYDLAEKVNAKVTTLADLTQSDVDAAITYAEKHENELALGKLISETLHTLGELRAVSRMYQSKDGVDYEPDKEKRAEAVRELKAMELEAVGWLREIRAEYKL